VNGGRAGFEPATFCASGNPKLNWLDFREWLNKKYSKTWAYQVLDLSKKYQHMLYGNLRELDLFSKWKKNNVLKALIALSKYLGIYEQFKAKVKNYGVKRENQNSVESFLRMVNTKTGLQRLS